MHVSKSTIYSSEEDGFAPSSYRHFERSKLTWRLSAADLKYSAMFSCLRWGILQCPDKPALALQPERNTEFDSLSVCPARPNARRI